MASLFQQPAASAAAAAAAASRDSAAGAKSVGLPTDYMVKDMQVLDALLRCVMCLEFFNVPVMLRGCSHNFCSECIRRHLVYQKQTNTYSSNCPVCSKDASATDLVPNRVLEHIIGAYSAARPLLVNALRSEPAARTAATLPVQSQKLQQQQQLSPPLSAELSPVSAAMPTTASASSSTSTKSGSKRGGKRAAAAQPPPQLKLEPATPTAKRSATAVMNSTRSTSATANSNSIASSLRKPPHIVLLADDDDDDDDAVANGSRAGKTNGDDDDDDFVPAPQQRRQQSNGGSSSARISNRQNGSNRSVPSSATATPKQPAAGTAPCPVCSEHVPCTQINIHLDECLTRESRRSSLRRLRSAERLGETNTQQQNETAARVTPPPSSPAIAASPSASPVALRSSPRLKAAVGRTESSQKTATLNEELSEVATIPVTDVKSFLPVSFYEAPKERRKPLPKMVYKLVKDKDLRVALEKLGLPSWGSRRELIGRHEEYALLYNAQCDAANPLSPREIVAEIMRRETQRQAPRSNGAGTASVAAADRFFEATSSSGDVAIAQVRSAYVDENAEHFRYLIRTARKRLKRKLRRPVPGAWIRLHHRDPEPVPEQESASVVNAAAGDVQPTKTGG